MGVKDLQVVYTMKKGSMDCSEEKISCNNTRICCFRLLRLNHFLNGGKYNKNAPLEP